MEAILITGRAKIWIPNCWDGDMPHQTLFRDLKKKIASATVRYLPQFTADNEKPPKTHSRSNHPTAHPIQRHPVSLTIRGEEVLISRRIQLITVTSKRPQGVLLAQGTAQQAGLAPIKPSWLKVQHSVTSAGRHFGLKLSTCNGNEYQSLCYIAQGNHLNSDRLCACVLPAGQPQVANKRKSTRSTDKIKACSATLLAPNHAHPCTNNKCVRGSVKS